MIIIWKDPNMRLHGKRHKNDRYYFRWHYGKQRRVYMYTEYVDKPTEKQVSAREAFAALRREVSRQLRDADLRAEWMRRFEADNEGYKFLHTYVYAKMKAQPSAGGVCTEQTRESLRNGETKTAGSAERGQTFRSAEVQKFRIAEVQRCRKSELPVVLLYNGTLLPLFLPSEVPREERFCVLGEKEVSLRANL